MNIDVRYLPGLAMRQLARLHAGNSKTDVRDAYVIAHAGLKLPDSLRTVDRTCAAFRQLKVLNGIDEDLTRAYTRSINQIRAALIGTYPGFEQVLRGQTIHRLWILKLLARYGGPTKLTRLGKTRTIEFARKNGARNPLPIIEALFGAIAAQTVTIDGADLAEIGIMMGAQDALTKLAHRKQIEAEVLTIAQEIPQYTILLSMPGIGPKTATTILMTAGDFSDFPTAAHLASYAGIAPRTFQSGTSINSTGLNQAGNNKLKNALWISAFASLNSHKRSRQYYDRKRAEGKRHNAAITALARRRINVLFMMMKNYEFFDDNQADPPTSATLDAT